MTVRTPDSDFEAVEHQADRLARVVPYLLLAFPLLPYVVSQYPTAGAFGITVGVAAAAAAWITWMIVLHPGWAQRAWPMRIYFAGLLVFIAVLTIRSPWFAFFTWIGFLQAFMLLSRGVAVGVLRDGGRLLRHGSGRGIPPPDGGGGGDLDPPGLPSISRSSGRSSGWALRPRSRTWPGSR